MPKTFETFKSVALAEGFDEVPHSARYGAEGASYWVARLN